MDIGATTETVRQRLVAGQTTAARETLLSLATTLRAEIIDGGSTRPVLLYGAFLSYLRRGEIAEAADVVDQLVVIMAEPSAIERREPVREPTARPAPDESIEQTRARYEAMTSLRLRGAVGGLLSYALRARDQHRPEDLRRYTQRIRIILAIWEKRGFNGGIDSFRLASVLASDEQDTRQEALSA